jgi:hypothetical protein
MFSENICVCAIKKAARVKNIFDSEGLEYSARPQKCSLRISWIFCYLLWGGDEVFSNNLPFACREGSEPTMRGENLGRS